MTRIAALFRYQFRIFTRESMTWVLVGSFVALYAVATFNGKQKVQEFSSSQSQHQKLIMERNQAYLEHRFSDNEKLGRFFYYVQAPIQYHPHPRAALNLGRLDLYEDIPGITLHGIYSQVFNAGRKNPFSALSGHFDLAFVLIHLVPLLVLLFVFDLRQREVELGLRSLLNGLGIRDLSWMLSKWFIRLVSVGGLVSGLNLAVFYYFGLPLDSFFLFWSLASVLYILFWMLVGLAITSFRLQSTTNLVVSLIAWILLCILTPASIHLMSGSHSSAPSGIQIATEHRYKLHAAWDHPKQDTFAAFEFTGDDQAAFTKENDTFTWGWYFAMHSVADHAVTSHVHDYFKSALERDNWIERASRYLPPLRLQTALDKLCGVTLENQVDFKRDIVRFHQELKQHYYPAIFDDRVWNKAQLTSELTQLSTKKITPNVTNGGLLRMAPIVVWCLGLTLFTFLIFSNLTTSRRNGHAIASKRLKRAA